MFSHHDESGYVPVIDGIQRKTLVHGEKTLMSEFRIRAGSVLPDHDHPHEQTGYLVSGRLGYQSFPTVESDFAGLIVQVAIPAASGVGLGLMTIALAGAGVWLSRRRKK